MRHSSIWMIGFVSISALGLAACDVDKTEEGELPDVDVSVDGGELPNYEVETADVEVEQDKRTVTVPDVDVDTEEREITVPDIDVEMPGESEARKQADVATPEEQR